LRHVVRIKSFLEGYGEAFAKPMGKAFGKPVDLDIDLDLKRNYILDYYLEGVKQRRGKSSPFLFDKKTTDPDSRLSAPPPGVPGDSGSVTKQDLPTGSQSNGSPPRPSGRTGGEATSQSLPDPKPPSRDRSTQMGTPVSLGGPTPVGKCLEDTWSPYSGKNPVGEHHAELWEVVEYHAELWGLPKPEYIPEGDLAHRIIEAIKKYQHNWRKILEGHHSKASKSDSKMSNDLSRIFPPARQNNREKTNRVDMGKIQYFIQIAPREKPVGEVSSAVRATDKRVRQEQERLEREAQEFIKNKGIQGSGPKLISEVLKKSR
jgi:hypothetical protein